jgi:hypothetical protein
MNRVLAALASGLFGLVVCIGVRLLVVLLGLSPKIPAFAGEDDFAVRMQYFLFLVCPAFAILGAWIGNAFGRSPRLGACMWLGVVAGSLLTFLGATLLGSTLTDLTTRAAANHAVLGLFLAWVLLSALGAYGGKLSVAPR